MHVGRAVVAILAVVGLVALLFGCAELKKEKEIIPPEKKKVTYDDIRPLLEQYCVRCHGSEKQEGHYDLSTYIGILDTGSDDVPNAIPGDVNSLLVQVTRPGGTMFQYLGNPAASDLILQWVVHDSLAIEKSDVHPDGWVDRGSPDFHGKFLKARSWDLTNCQKCHGKDLKGGLVESSCFSCHDNYPHPAGWKDQEEQPTFHGKYVERRGPSSCTFCHGTDFKGGDTGVSCYDCHSGAGGHPSGWTDPDNINFHGLYLLNTGWNLAACQECHGTDYRGGTSKKSCYDCHQQGPEDCQVCHGQPPVDDQTLPVESEKGVNAYGAHEHHVEDLGFACTECHGQMPTSIQHADRLPAEIDFISAAQFANGRGMRGSYQDIGSATDGNGVCNNTYCHSDGKLGNAVEPPQWVGGEVSCTSCHQVETSGSGAHAHHLEYSQISCQTCHAATASGRDTVTDPSKHIRNMQVDVVFDPALNPDATPYGQAGAGTCSGLYCHSDGKGGVPAVQPVWSGEDLGCNSCHDVRQNGSGAHKEHLDEGIGCFECHFNTVDAGQQIRDWNVHIFNKKVDVVFNPARNPNAEYGTAGPGTCSNVSCHGEGLPGGSNTQPVWTDPETAACGSCHDTGETDTTPNTVISTGMHARHVRTQNGGLGFDCYVCHAGPEGDKHVNGQVDLKDGTRALSTTTVCNGCHGSGVQEAKNYWAQTEGAWLAAGGYCESCHDGSSTVLGRPAPNVLTYFTTSGHGNSGPFPATDHGQNGPGYSCDVCHDPAAGNHIQPQVHDYRLVVSNARSELCLACHSPDGPSGSFATDAADANIHSYTVTGNFTNIPQFDYQCVVCHDPHGTENLAMIRPQIDGGLGAGPVQVNFKGSLSNLDPTSAPDDGVCDVCHAQGGQPHAATEKPGNHNYGLKCVFCHRHKDGFKLFGK
jgi:predicted CxxxxCH...CXXCH cytochrome family protein